jgi:hypothetical protein
LLRRRKVGGGLLQLLRESSVAGHQSSVGKLH